MLLIVLDFLIEVVNNNDFIVICVYIEVWEKEYGIIEFGIFVVFCIDWLKCWFNIEKFENKDVNG